MRQLNLTPLSICFGVVSLFSVVQAQAAPQPLLQYKFNEGSGTIAATNGSLVSGNATLMNGATFGAGLTGAAGDYALNLTAANAMGTASSTSNAGYARVASPAIQNLTSFTLTGWMKGEESPTNGARLMVFTGPDNSGFSLNCDGVQRLTFTVDGVGGSNGSDLGAYDMTRWTFFAVTYDGTLGTNNVRFYIGGADGASLAQVGIRSIDAGTTNTNSANPPVLCIGNNGGPVGNQARPFDGYLDNFAIYGSTADATGSLTLAQLQEVYAGAVPEPATLSLVAAVGGLLLVRRRR